MRVLVIAGTFATSLGIAVSAQGETNLNGATSSATPGPSPAPPQAPAADAAAAPPLPKDIRDEVPLINYTTSAFGVSRFSAGALGQAGVLGGGVSATQAGGGARIWGSPLQRLTLFLEVQRPFYGEAAPSATALVRILGSRQEGWAIGSALAYRTDGFAEVAGEIEGSVLFSVARGNLHVDSTVTFGGGLEENEADGELKLRAGYDVTSWLRVGVDGRFRYRLAGVLTLPGKRVGDAVGGPEVLISYKYFFLDLTGGPSTVAVPQGFGWTALSTLGAAIF